MFLFLSHYLIVFSRDYIQNGHDQNGHVRNIKVSVRNSNLSSDLEIEHLILLLFCYIITISTSISMTVTSLVNPYVVRRRFMPQRRQGGVGGRACSLLLVSRQGVLSQ